MSEEQGNPVSQHRRAEPEVEQKPKAGYAPVYAAMYPEMAEIARKHGYALCIHGSMRRDFDVIAVPWVDEPSKPQALVEELTRAFAMNVIGEPGPKPHGRIAYTLSIGFGECFADLSFMPTVGSGDDYVAWLCYDRHESGVTTIKTCDSDAKGAFKVYRHAPKSQPQPAVPEIPPAVEVATVWPRYFEPVTHRKSDLLRRVCRDELSPSEWAHGGPQITGEVPRRACDLERDERFIETDAEGNALQKQEAENLNPACINCSDGGCEWCEPKQEASGVERFATPERMQRVSEILKGFDPLNAPMGNWMPQSDHDRVVREKDATIAMLNQRAKQAEDRWVECRTRDEAAEAKCAELEREVESLQCEVYCPKCGGCGTEGCCSPNACELVKCKYPHNVETWEENMKTIETLTAQLAAANDKLRAVDGERDGLEPPFKMPLPILPTSGERSLGQLLYETLYGQVEGMKPLCGEPYARILPESIARYEHAAKVIALAALPQPGKGAT